ncbi:hypothetical protein [Glycomyces sp. NRRL B-16210]|uniref:hypothetical protein n=1 Tax=Glycomyces sp. NRRL B-16210 TaxID=1463821 RepID=UPI0010615044|nr:hypothetical protein [Glycomyces sp. NRRL B-16210]
MKHYCVDEKLVGPHPGTSDDSSKSTRWSALIQGSLDARTGWEKHPTSDLWTYSPSIPRVEGTAVPPPSCRLLGTTFSAACGVLFPPSVKFIFDEEDCEGEAEEASLITGTDNPLLRTTGVVTAIYLPSPFDLDSRLPEIESWRWPARLPRTGFGAGEEWYRPLPPDFEQLAEVIGTRRGWSFTAEPNDWEPLAYPFQKLEHWKGDELSCSITTWDRTDDHRYLIRPRDGIHGLLVPNVHTIIKNIAYIESWGTTDLPRWYLESDQTWRHRQCPSCKVPPHERCDADGTLVMLHVERLSPGALELSDA